MPSHACVRILFSGAIALVISSGVAANPPLDEGLSLSLGGAYNALNNDRNLNDTGSPEIGLGYRFNNRWSLEAIYADYTTKHTFSNEAKINDYRLDGLYDLTPWKGHWTPYAVIGAGHFIEKYSDTIDHADTRVNLGVGLRKSLTPNLSFNTDVRAIQSLDYGHTESMVRAALTWVFGSNSLPKRPAILENRVMPSEPETPKDSDQDGVPDKNDLCPQTPPDSKVDSSGCVAKVDIDLLVEFAFNSDEIAVAELEQVNKMGEFLNRYPKTLIRVIGHTDSQGPEDYNKKLSYRRAIAVTKYLTEQYGIDPSRIEAVGQGESNPIADNNTAEGQQKNRRVVAEILK